MLLTYSSMELVGHISTALSDAPCYILVRRLHDKNNTWQNLQSQGPEEVYGPFDILAQASRARTSKLINCNPVRGYSSVVPEQPRNRTNTGDNLLNSHDNS
jgi:hypothetical protein